VLREPARLIAYRRLLLDVLLTAGSFLLAHQLRSSLLPRLLPSLFPGGLYPLRDYLPLLGAVLPLWFVLLAAQRLTAPGQVLSLRREAFKELQVAALGVVLLAAAGYLLRLHFVSRPFLLLFGVINGAVLAAARVLERRTPWGRRLVEVPERMVVVVGCGTEAVALARQVVTHRAWGLSLRGIVDADGCGRRDVEGFPVLGAADLLSREVVDEVVLAVPTRQLGEFERSCCTARSWGRECAWHCSRSPLQPHVEVGLDERRC
jgi:FlaA1/EpsC-like NDP-sugar epimerase